MSKIIVIGSINMDVVAKTPNLPVPGETVFGHDLQFIPGGKGANQAVAAARLGDTVHMVGKLGRDAFGSNLETFLSNENLDLTNLGFSDTSPTGTALIVVDEQSENTIVVVSGSNADISIDDVQSLNIASDDILISQFEVPQVVILDAFTRAREIDAITILNTAPAQECAPELLDAVRYLILNETELAFYAGTATVPETNEEIITVAKKLRGIRDQTIIVTLGAKGVICIDKDDVLIVPAFEVDAVDTTAAGDCFVGALAVALREEQDLRSALRFANGASALSVQVFGASASLPMREKVNAFLKQHM